MHAGKPVFARIMPHLPLVTFRRCAARGRGEYRVRSFSRRNQFLALTLAQLTFRENLRDNEARLRAQAAMLYHSDARGGVATPFLE